MMRGYHKLVWAEAAVHQARFDRRADVSGQQQGAVACAYAHHAGTGIAEIWQPGTGMQDTEFHFIPYPSQISGAVDMVIVQVGVYLRTWVVFQEGCKTTRMIEVPVADDNTVRPAKPRCCYRRPDH